MAKRKKTDDDSDEYDVKIGFIHEFIVHDSRYSERMNGHPMEGRVYRLIKDPSGYRLHIGRENNDANLDGIFLGPDLEGEQKAFQYKIEIVTKDNYLKLPIQQEDTEQIVHWISIENQDLWESIRNEQSGAQIVVRTQEDLLAFLRKVNEKKAEEEQQQLIVPYNQPKRKSRISYEQKENALEITLNVIIQFKNKSADDILYLFDGLYDRILTIQND